MSAFAASLAFLSIGALGLAGCSASSASDTAPMMASGPNQEVAIFAGGCFWTMETKFDHVPGVVDVTVGVTGGRGGPPTQEEFARGQTGNVEAVAVKFDTSKISYRQLVDRYWLMIDPTDAKGQACDRGPNYATAVFATSKQRAAAVASRQKAITIIGASRFVTPIRPASAFWPAPSDAQDFAKLNPERYDRYNRGCGRANRLSAVWDGAHPLR